MAKDTKERDTAAKASRSKSNDAKKPRAEWTKEMTIILLECYAKQVRTSATDSGLKGKAWSDCVTEFIAEAKVDAMVYDKDVCQSKISGLKKQFAIVKTLEVRNTSKDINTYYL